MIPELQGPFSCAREILLREGAAAFYKGFSTPFAAQVAYKSVLFSVNGLAKRMFEATSCFGAANDAKVLVCGFMSGSVNSIVVTPVELIRNQLMMQTDDRSMRFTGPRAIVRHIYGRCNGNGYLFVRALYRGWSATVVRDSFGVAFWFWGFDFAQRSMKKFLGTEHLCIYHLLLCGSFSGICFWSVALPFDTLKSKIQCSYLDSPSLSMRSLLGKLSLSQVPTLFRGYQVAFGRGIPGAAITLTVHNLISRHVE